MSYKTMTDKYEYQELITDIERYFIILKPSPNYKEFFILKSDYYKTRQMYGF